MTIRAAVRQVIEIGMYPASIVQRNADILIVQLRDTRLADLRADRPTVFAICLNNQMPDSAGGIRRAI